MVGRDGGDGGALARALATDGWDVRGPSPAEEWRALIMRETPGLILIDGRAKALPPIMPFADSTAGTPLIITIPVVLLGEMPATWPAGTVDEHLSTLLPPEDIVAALRLWQPRDLLAGARRLEAVFGAAEIRAMVAGFRRQLVEAVELFDRSGEAGLAHRVAGIAGTLGFAAVGTRWLALSEGDADAWPDARREARKAIAAIDRAG